MRQTTTSAMRATTLAAVAALHFLATGSHAQTPTVPAPAHASGLFSLPDGVRITLGAQVIMQPKYEGSSSYEVSAVPVFKLTPLGGGAGGGLIKSFDAKSLDDISFGLFEFGKLEIGPLFGYRLGREEKDSPRLCGLGDVEGGLIAGAFAKYDFGPLFLRASFHQRLTGDDTGFLVRLATGREFRVTRQITVKADAYLDIADDAYMSAYFGVSQVQSMRSGLRPFDAGAGLKSAGVMLGTEYEVIPNWRLLASAGYTRLFGDAASSPIVESPDRFEARLGASRSFDWRMR